MTDVDTERVRAVYDHLSATAERPVSREVTHYLGEAEAVAADAVAAAESGEREAVERRLEQVADLLGEVGETGDEEADEHLAAAKSLLPER